LASSWLTTTQKQHGQQATAAARTARTTKLKGLGSQGQERQKASQEDAAPRQYCHESMLQQP